MKAKPDEAWFEHPLPTLPKFKPSLSFVRSKKLSNRPIAPSLFLALPDVILQAAEADEQKPFSFSITIKVSIPRDDWAELTIFIKKDEGANRRGSLPILSIQISKGHRTWTPRIYPKEQTRISPALRIGKQASNRDETYFWIYKDSYNCMHT